MKTIYIFVLTIVVTFILGLILEIPLISILDQWCLYDPWYLSFKNKHIYFILMFVIFMLLPAKNIKTLPAVIIEHKETIRISLYTMLTISVISYFYFTWFYGNPGWGACSNPKININYYKYPGQDMYLD